jgi:hypothetical protein
LAIVLLASAGLLHSQEPNEPEAAPRPPESAPEGAATSDEDDWGFVPIPVLGYSPDTGVLLGASGFLFWQPDTNVTSTDNNTTSLVLFYGTRGVFASSANAGFNLADGAYKPEVGLFVGRSPSDFYGIGPDAELDNAEVYTAFTMDAEAVFLARIRPGLYAGPAARWIYQDVVEVETDGILDSEEITGDATVRSVGGGAQLVWDTREPQLYPLSGRYLSFTTVGHPGALASHDGYTFLGLDYREFITISGRHILAAQGIAETTVGDAPFHYLPYLGGMNELRGYPEGRYRDDVALQAQLEYRFPIWWRFGGVVFAAAGQVAPAFDELSFSDVPAAAGLGLRFTIETSQNLNLRFDFALTRENTTSFYVSFREAF